MKNKECPVCGTAEGLTSFEDRWMQLFHSCSECDTVWKDSLLFLSSENEKARYDQHNNTLENTGYVAYLTDFMEKAVLPFVSPEEGKLLDFGCGPGPVLSRLLERLGFTTHQYDPFYADNAAWLTHTYQGVFAVEVMEHVSSPLDALSKIHGRLMKGGYLMIRTELKPSSAEEFRKWWYKDDPTHIMFYSLKSWETLCGWTGFSVRKTLDGNKIILQKTG